MANPIQHPEAQRQNQQKMMEEQTRQQMAVNRASVALEALKAAASEPRDTESVVFGDTVRAANKAIQDFLTEGGKSDD